MFQKSDWASDIIEGPVMASCELSSVPPVPGPGTENGTDQNHRETA